MPRWAFVVVDLWAKLRAAGGAMPGAPRALPGAGGLGDQPAALMDALAIIEGVAREGAE